MARWDEERGRGEWRAEGRDPYSAGDGGSGAARPGERSNEGWRSERWRGEDEGWRGREERDDRGSWGEPIRRGEQRTYRAGGRGEWGGEHRDWRGEGSSRGEGWRGGERDWRSAGSRGGGESWRSGEGWSSGGRESGWGGGREGSGGDWRDRDQGQRYGQDFERRESGYGGYGGSGEERGRGMYGGGMYGREYGRESEGDWSRRGMWGEPSYGSDRDRSGRMRGESRDYDRYESRDLYGRSEGHEDRGAMERFGDKMREGWRRMTGKGPKGYKRSDERIREDVCERIARAGIEADDVEVKVQNAEVTLTGEVSRRDDKRMLEDLAEDVFGVDEVQNQLRVRREGMRTSTQTGQAATSPSTTPGTTGTQAMGQQRGTTSPTQQPPQRH